MVTIKDIAKECNVSITTVSNVLNDKSKVGEQTKQKILEVIQKRGYRPNTIAQGLRSQKTKVIGIIADDIAQFTTPEIIEGIMSYCEKKVTGQPSEIFVCMPDGRMHGIIIKLPIILFWIRCWKNWTPTWWMA